MKAARLANHHLLQASHGEHWDWLQRDFHLQSALQIIQWGGSQKQRAEARLLSARIALLGGNL